MSYTDTQGPAARIFNAPNLADGDDLGLQRGIEQASRIAAYLEAVFDVPVAAVSAVLGRSKMDVRRAVFEARPRHRARTRTVASAKSDRHLRNNRLVARGEVVLGEDKLGVTMTEIIKRNATKRFDDTRITGANRRTGDYDAAFSSLDTIEGQLTTATKIAMDNALR